MAVVGVTFLIALNAIISGSVIVDVYRLDLNDVQYQLLLRGGWMNILFTLIPIAAIAFVHILPINPIAATPLAAETAWRIALGKYVAGCGVAVFGIGCIVMKFAGIEVPPIFENFFFILFIVYVVLLQDDRNIGHITDIDFVISIVSLIFAIAFETLGTIFFAIMVLLRPGQHVQIRQILNLGAMVGAIIIVVLATRRGGGGLNLLGIYLRLTGSEFNFLKHYAFDFHRYQCFGIGTMWGFLDRQGYDQFYKFYFDPLQFGGDIKFRWDSSNLFERLNYWMCSEYLSFLMYFSFLSLGFFLERRLNDIRYFKFNVWIIIGSFEGFAVYSLPYVAMFLILYLSGIFRIMTAGPTSGRSHLA